mmetsp:Transcript_69175/g.109190  ORF Transcript_69175/g.109190 Transcript_69175/m.109190 type:complete len:339 (+) Transcript_69175:295-1311(+)
MQQGELAPHVAMHCHQASYVLATNFFGGFLNHHITHLEESDGRRKLLVIGQGFQNARDESCSHNLEANCLWVGHRDGRRGRTVFMRLLHRQLCSLGIWLPAHPGVVLLLRQQGPVHTLREPCHGQFCTHHVRQIVHRLPARHGHGLRHAGRQLVVAIGNGQVLYEITFVHDITACHWHLDVQDIFVLAIHVTGQTHLPQIVPDLLALELLEAQGSLHPRDVRRHLPRVQHRIDLLVTWFDEGVAGIVIGIQHLNRFRHERLLAVLREHRHHGVQHHVGLRQIRGRTLDEDIFGFQLDLGVFAVDDGRQGQDHSITVVDHRVHRAVADDGQIGLQLLMC